MKPTTYGWLLVVTIVSITLLLAFAPGCATETHTTDANGITHTNLEPNHTAIGIANTGNAIAQAIPTPWSPVIEAGSGLIAGVATIIATFQNKRRREHAKMLQATIGAIEQANIPALKQNVCTIATALGVQNQLHQVVQEVTSVLPPR